MDLHVVTRRLLALAAIFTAFLMPAASITASAQSSQPSVISVKDTGAVGDGVADDTAAFEKAITRSRESGATVQVPPGRYKITRTLTLKAQSLLGSQTAAWVADDVSMPTILPEGKDGPCIRLLGGGSVHGLHFSYNWGNQAPSVRPPTIELSGVGCRVSEVKIHGAWDGIIADGKSNVGRSIVDHCFLVDIHNVGVRITATYDVTWVSKVEVWSPSSKTFPESGVGFQFGKNDVLLVSDCFAFRAYRGYQLIDDIPGCEVKGGTWGSLSNCTADFSTIGIEVKGSHTVSVNGGTYWTHFGGMVVNGKDAQVRVSGLELSGNGGPALTVEDCDLVTASACQLRRKHEGFDVPALRITGGKNIVVTGCVLTSTSKGSEVKEGLKDVLLANNIVRENIKEEKK